MRPPNNKRARGRTNRRSPNPNRSYDSNGPEGKIRGNASQVYEKYSQLARDSAATGDPITAEGYWQHAEHYYRIMMALQQNRPQQQPNQNPNQQNAQGQDEGDSGNGGNGGNGTPDGESQSVDPAQQEQPEVQANSQQPVTVEESDTAGLERVVRPKRARRPRRPREESNDDAPQKAAAAEPAAPEAVEGAAD